MKNNLIFLCLTKSNELVSCRFSHDELIKIAQDKGLAEYVAVDLSNKEDVTQVLNIFFKRIGEK